MSGIFNYENPIFSFLGKVIDLISLSVLWVILCLPIVTIGPATTALYYTVVKVVRKERSYLFREFFKSFKSNFKYGALATIIVVLLAAILWFDFNFAKLMMGILPKSEFVSESVDAGAVSEDVTVGDFVVTAKKDGSTVVEETNTIVSNGSTYLRALKLGAGSATEGNIKFVTEGNTDILVYALNKTENKSVLTLADESGAVIETAEVQSFEDFEVAPAVTFNVEKAGTYYIYVSDADTEIYYMSTATLVETTEFQEKMGYAMYVIFMAMMFMLILTLMFIFPVLSRFKMNFKLLCKNSFFMAMKHFPTAILVALIVALTGLIMWFLWPYPTFIILPGLCCLLVSFPIERVFKKYMPTKEEANEPGKDLWYLE